MSCPVCGEHLPERAAITGGDRQGVAAGTFEVRVCERCGGGTTLPPATEEEIAAFYAGAYGPHSRGGASGALARATMAARLRTRLFRRLAAAVPANGVGPRRLLDVGSGAGDLAGVLAERGWRTVGVEPSPEACETARTNGVEALCGTIESVDLAGHGPFDAAVFHHSLEHVPDPVGALRTAAAAMRPGGVVAVAVPNFDSPQRRRLGGAWWALDLPRHRFHFAPESLRRALEAGGFEVEWLRPTVSVLGPAANAQSRLTGRMSMAGPGFMAGYGLALAAYPVRWAAGEARGSGEFLAALGRCP